MLEIDCNLSHPVGIEGYKAIQAAAKELHKLKSDCDIDQDTESLKQTRLKNRRLSISETKRQSVNDVVNEWLSKAKPPQYHRNTKNYKHPSASEDKADVQKIQKMKEHDNDFKVLRW